MGDDVVETLEAAGRKLCMRIERLRKEFALSLWLFGSMIAKLIRFQDSCVLSNGDGGRDDMRPHRQTRV